MPGPPGVDFAVLSTSVMQGSVWRINRPIEVEFTHDIDFSTVSPSTVQIIDSQGAPAIGTYRLLDARTIQFQPRCPTNNANSDGGFGQGRSYRVTIASLSNSGLGGGVTVRNTAGESLEAGFTVNFTTPLSNDAGVLFADMVAGPPSLRILGPDDAAPASTANAIHSYVEFGGDIENFEFFRFDPADQQGAIESLVPLNLYSDTSQQFAIVLSFNQAVAGSTDNVNSDLIRLEYFNAALGEWFRVASSVELQQNCSLAGASVRIQPRGIVPQGSALRVSLREGFSDLIGQRIQSTQPGVVQFESNVANPGAPAGQEADGGDEILERFTLAGDAPGSLEDTEALSARPRANWGTSASPGALSASFDFNGTGGQGGDFDILVREGAILIIDTDFDVVTGGPGGSNSSSQSVFGGRVDVRNLTVEQGARLVFIGSNTATILATGEVRVDGTISVNGGANFGVSTLATANFPEEGAPGQAGGGDGGTASSLSTSSTPRGSRGQGAFGTAGQGGEGGEATYAAPLVCQVEARRAAGGGGGLLGGDVRYDVDGTFLQPLAICQILVGLDAEPGFPGSFEGLGAVSQTTSAQGGATGRGPFVDASPDNNFFGTLITPAGNQIRGELTSVWAGAGGGGGGDAISSSTFPLTPFTAAGDEKGSGGGGGAGGLLVLAIGDIVVGPSGSVTADGGHGGGGENTNGLNRVGGGSGGGSGGHIVMSSAGSIIIEAEVAGEDVGAFYRDNPVAVEHPLRPLRALGGQGGAGRGNRCGAGGAGARPWRSDAIPFEAFEGRSDIPPNVAPLSATFQQCNLPPTATQCAGVMPAPLGTAFGAGGDGGPGIIQLHVSDPDTQLVFGGAGQVGYLTASIDVTPSMAPPPIGWRSPMEQPGFLVPFFSARSESFSRWIPLGLARQNPDGSTGQVEFIFEGTNPDASIPRAGAVAGELAPIVVSTALSLGGATPSLDVGTAVLRVAGSDLQDPNGLYVRNAMLLREYAVRLSSSSVPQGEVEYTVVSASYDAATLEFALVLDPRGAALATDVGELTFGSGQLQVEVVPFYYRLVTGGVVDQFPEGSDVKVLFDATLADPLTSEPSSAPEAAYSARIDPLAMDINVKNGFATQISALNGPVAQQGQSNPNNVLLESVSWDFVRFKVEFDLAVGAETPDLSARRPGLDFLRLPYRF